MFKRLCFFSLTMSVCCLTAFAQPSDEWSGGTAPAKAEAGKVEVSRNGSAKVIKTFYSDGSLYSEMSFVWSLPHGEFKIFYSNGQVYERGEYFLGFKIKRELFYEDGVAKSPEIEALERKLRAVDMRSNVHMHNQADLFFDLARGYLKDGRKKEARETLEEGIRLAPFYCEGQLMLAEMDMQDGYLPQVVERLQFIRKDCKDKKLLSRAERLHVEYAILGDGQADLLLNRAERLAVEDAVLDDGQADQKLPYINKVLYVAVTANVPKEISGGIIKKVIQQYAVEVRLLDNPYVAPEDLLAQSQERYLDLIIQRAFAKLTFEQLNSILKKTEMEGRPQSLEQKNFFYEAYIAQTEGAQSLVYRKNALSQQLDADLMLNAAIPVYQALLDDAQTLGVLILTEQDIRADDLNYLFGTADIPKRIGLMSFARFTADRPSLEKLLDRSVKQAFSTVGFIAGIGRCTMPDCARAYPHSLAEHDKKGKKICNICLQNLAEVYRNTKN